MDAGADAKKSAVELDDTRVRTIHRNYPGFSVVFVLLAAILVLPLFYTSFLPLIELPLRVGELAVLLDYRDPALHFSDYYQASYFSWRFPLRTVLLLPGALFGAELTYRLVVIAALLLVSWGVLAVIAARRLDPWSSTLAFLVVHSSVLHRGHVEHWLAMGFALFALASWEKREHASGRTLLIWGFWALATAICSPQAYLHLFFILLVLSVLWLAKARWCGQWKKQRVLAKRRFVTLALAQLPAWLLTIGHVVHARAMSLDPARAIWLEDSETFISLKLARFPRAVGRLWRGLEFDYLVPLLALLVLFMALAASRAVRLRNASSVAEPDNLPAGRLDSWVGALYQQRYLAIAALFLVGFFFLPRHLVWLPYALWRLPSTGMLLLVIALGSLVSWRFWPVRLTSTVTVGFFVVYAGLYLLLFSRESEEFAVARAAVPHGARYRCHVDSSRSAVVNFPVYRHFCGYALAARGGLVGYLDRSSGVDFKPPYALPQRRLVEWFGSGWRGFPHHELGNRYDYYLLRSRSRRCAFDRPPLSKFVELVRRTRTWHVYRRVRRFRRSDRGPGLPFRRTRGGLGPLLRKKGR
jgi:hypothetical protein